MAELYIFYQTHMVGILRQKGPYLPFIYTKEWLNNPLAFPISLSLPLQEGEFEDSRHYFAGLLPEGLVREHIVRHLQIGVHDDFKLLEALGGDCAGALVITPTPDPPLSGTKEPITRDNLANLLKTHYPLLSGIKDIRLSLAGAQEKHPIIYENSQFFIPQGYPSTHIIKCPIGGYEDTVINEAFCLHLARKIGLPTVESQLVDIHGTTYLLVKRYDRTEKGMRLHQEDFCQALAIPSERKYEKDGGPTVQNVLEILKQHTTIPVSNIQRFMDYFIFSYLIGNRDAHGKNYGLLYNPQGIELTPLYDVMRTTAYENLASKMAMRIAKKYDPKFVTLKDWYYLAKVCNLSPAYVENRLYTLSKLIKERIGETVQELFEDSAPTFIEKETNKLLKELSLWH